MKKKAAAKGKAFPLQPIIRSFSRQNLWRICRLYETCRDQPILSPVVRELPWSLNFHILSRAKRPEEREFYFRMSSRNRWQVQEVARQMNAPLFEKAVLNPPKVSPVVRQFKADLCGFLIHTPKRKEKGGEP